MEQLLHRAAEIVLQSRDLAFAHLDRHGVVMAHSANFIAQLGLVGESALGQSAWAWDVLVGAEADLQAVLAGHSPQFDVLQVQISDRHFVNVHVLALQPGHPEHGWLMLVHNITPLALLQQALTQERNELRLAQAQLRAANAELDRLNRFRLFMLSMVAHDLRAPLAALRGYAELVEARVAARHRPYLHRIVGLTERANLLIQNLIDLGQLERGALALRRSRVDFTALCENVLTAHQPLAALRKQTLTLHAPAEPVYAQADAERVQQILDNLLNNAIKYTPAGGQIAIHLTAEPGQVSLEVRDTGPGLTAEQQANLFQLHYRTEPTRQSKAPGSGLGLFIVKTLATAHGGTVTVHSAPGLGSVFRVVLPAGEP